VIQGEVERKRWRCVREREMEGLIERGWREVEREREKDV